MYKNEFYTAAIQLCNNEGCTLSDLLKAAKKAFYMPNISELLKDISEYENNHFSDGYIPTSKEAEQLAYAARLFYELNDKEE